jgi:hypothetical protein
VEGLPGACLMRLLAGKENTDTNVCATLQTHHS